jgi:hypothetical protein
MIMKPTGTALHRASMVLLLDGEETYKLISDNLILLS